MEIRAYDESYVDVAQNILGHAVDFAVCTLNIGPDVFGDAFVVSDVSKQFAVGNPRYVAGMNGPEMARLVLDQIHIDYTDTEDIMFLDKSPEYWAGWALAYYQWYSAKSFMDIISIVPLSKIISLYPVYHEMDIAQFADKMDSLLEETDCATNLKKYRTNCKLSQVELSKESGVALRQIQLFEQRRRDINNAASITLLKLSRSLHCKMEDLMEV